MHMTRIFPTLFILAALACATLAPAADLLIAVDGSGSMRGYFATGSLAELVDGLRSVAAAEGLSVDSQVFTSGKSAAPVSWHPWDDWQRGPQWGLETHLDQAFAEATASRPGAIVLLTDNFQDVQQGRGATNEFYAAMLRDSPQRIVLVPDLLTFQGKVELVGAGTQALAGGSPASWREAVSTSTPDRFTDKISSVSRLRSGGFLASYQGRRGLASYFVQLSAPPKRFDRVIASHRRTRDGVPALQLYPLGADLLSLEPATEGLSDGQLKCMGLADRSSIPPANLVLEPDGDGLRLVKNDGWLYDPRKPTRLVAAVKVSLEDPHIEIASGKSLCENSTSIRLENLAVDAGVGAAPGILANLEATGATLPATLVGRAGRAMGDQVVLLVVDLPAVVGQEVSDQALGKGLSARFDVVFRLPSRAFHLSEAVADRLFTATTLDVARIYSPADPVAYLSTKQVELRIPVAVTSDVFAERVVPAETNPFPFLGFGLLAMASWWWLRPLGYDAQFGTADSRFVHRTTVGGLLKPTEPYDVLVDGKSFNVRRARWWSRGVEVRDAAGTVLGQLAGPGTELNVGSGRAIKWIRKGY